MRHFAVLLLLFGASLFSQAQDADSLASYQPGYDYHVFPDGSLWRINSLTDCYRTAPGSGIFQKYDALANRLGDRLYSGYRHQSIDVCFPQPGIVLLHGNLQLGQVLEKTTIFLWSENSGQSWEVGYFPKGIHKEALGNDTAGTLWLLTKEDRLYHSTDLGENWNRVRLQPDQEARAAWEKHCLQLPDCRPGAIGSIEFTQDNWLTHQTLPAPDFRCGPEQFDHRALLVSQWQNGLLARQGEYLYYTPLDSLHWQCLRKDIFRTLVTPDGKELWVTTNRSKLFQYASPEAPPTQYDLPTPLRVYKMSWHNESLYLLGHERRLFYGNQEGFQVMTLVMEAVPIRAAVRCRTANSFYSYDRNEVFLSQDTGKGWKRIAYAPALIRDMRVADSNTLELWHDRRTSSLTRIDLSTYQSKAFDGTSPIVHFNIDSIVGVEVKSIQKNPYDYYFSILHYAADESGNLVPHFMETDTVEANLSLDSVRPISVQDLRDLLYSLQMQPDKPLQAGDFQVAPEEVQQFRETLPTIEHSPIDYRAHFSGVDIPYLESIPDSLRLASPDQLKNALRIGAFSRSFKNVGGSSFSVKIIDNTGRKLIFDCLYATQAAYLLPWHVQLDHHHYMSYHLAFSRFWQHHLPARFTGMNNFDPALLFWSMEAYLRKVGHHAP